MKRLFSFALVAAVSFALLTGCQESAGSEGGDKDSTEQSASTADLQPNTVAMINIEGMTCEVGCAKMIEARLNRLEGVLTATVNFENKMAEVKFDEGSINEKDMVAEIEGLGDGEMYKVERVDVKKVPVKEVKTEKTKTSCVKKESKSSDHGVKVDQPTVDFPNIFDAFTTLF